MPNPWAHHCGITCGFHRPLYPLAEGSCLWLGDARCSQAREPLFGIGDMIRSGARNPSPYRDAGDLRHAESAGPAYGPMRGEAERYRWGRRIRLVQRCLSSPLALKNQAPPAIHRTSGCFLTIQVAPMSAISGKRFVSNASVRRPLWNIGTKTSLLWSQRGSCGLREQDSGTSLSPCRGQLSRKA